MKLTIPTTEILRNYNGEDSFLTKYIANQIAIGAIDFSNRTQSDTVFNINLGVFEPSQSELGFIIDAGGEVESFLMVLKIPIAAMDSTVNIDLPDRFLYKNGTTELTYSTWFNASDRYINVANDYVYCLTITSKGTILTGTQILFMLGLSGSVELLQISDQEFTALQ